MIDKSDSRCAVVRFCYHSYVYDCIPNWTPLSPLPLLLKVEVRFISRSRKLRLITLTNTLITLDIRKTESDSCFIIHWTKKKNMEVMFLPLPWRQATQSARTWHDYPYKSCTAVIHDMITRDVWVSLLYNLQLDDVECADFKNFTVCFRPIRKEIVSSMYNNNTYYWRVKKAFSGQKFKNTELSIVSLQSSLKSEV